MRVFGILLIIFNLLAGGAFVYFATQDWRGRQEINAAALRHILLLQGLPLEAPQDAPEGFDAEDETPFVVEMAGGESTKTVSKKLLESYFQANATASPPSTTGTGTEPAPPAPKVPLAKDAGAVTNQITEVKRVQDLIKAELAKTALTSAEKLGLLRGWLLYQAENYETRTQYLALLSLNDAVGQPKTPEKLKEDADKLESILLARFASVIAAPVATDSPIDAGDKNAADFADRKAKIDAISDKDKLAKTAEWRAGPAQDNTERRLRLAHLLVHLDQDAVWQKRVMVIIGLRHYVKAIANQAARFVDMTRHVDRYIPDDQAVFIKQETQLRERATQNSERARAVAAIRAALTEQKNAKDDAVNRRRTQLKELTDQLNKIKAEVDELLVRQSGIEKQLYEIQREVGLTLEEVYRLEELLAAVERERYGMPPQP